MKTGIIALENKRLHRNLWMGQRLWRALFGAVCLLALAGCSALPFGLGAGTKLQPCPGFTVGILIGEDADPIAQEQRDGYELALQQINAEGGPGDCPVSLAYAAETAGDSQNQVERAIRSLVEEHRVVAILGGTSSQSSMFAASLANRFLVPMLIPSGGGLHVLPGENFWVFRLDASDEAYSLAAVEKIKEDLGEGAGVDIVFENTTFGNDAAVTAAGALELQQLHLVNYIPFDSGQLGYDRLIETVGNDAPDVLFLIFSRPDQAQALLAAFDKASLPLPMIVAQGGGFASRAFLQDSQGKPNPLAEGLVLVTPWINQLNVEAGAQFVRDFEAYTDVARKRQMTPGLYSAEAYKSLLVLVSALKNGTSAPGAASLKDIVKFRESARADLQAFRENKPPWGSITFATGGQNQQAMVYLVKVSNGKLVTIYPPGMIVP